jgi:hypothetical protein
MKTLRISIGQGQEILVLFLFLSRRLDRALVPPAWGAQVRFLNYVEQHDVSAAILDDDPESAKGPRAK